MSTPMRGCREGYLLCSKRGTTILSSPKEQRGSIKPLAVQTNDTPVPGGNSRMPVKIKNPRPYFWDQSRLSGYGTLPGQTYLKLRASGFNRTHLEPAAQAVDPFLNSNHPKALVFILA